MTLGQILEAKSLREVYMVWFTTEQGEQFFMGKHAHNYCKIREFALAYTDMRDAEKRCLGIRDEVKYQDVEDVGVNTIYIGNGITIS